MNWGWRIFLLYSLFVVLTLGAVFFTFSQDVFLVSRDYYKEEIAYQHKIDEMKNYASLKIPLEIQYKHNQKQVEFKYPTEFNDDNLEGKITFFRPSDARLDYEVNIKVGTGIQDISTQDLLRGLWKVKVNWTSNGKSYYTEKDLILK